MRSKIVIGNWKMHGSTSSNRTLLEALLLGLAAESENDAGMSRFGATGQNVCAVCVPFPYLAQAQHMLSATPVAWGAQNLSEYPQGAYTGEVSAAMLTDFGCRYVLVGHSERRALYGESSTVVASKFVAAQNAGLIPILCVGETLAEREAGKTVEVVTAQIESVLQKAVAKYFVDALIAYEPVWAIGTGKTATPQQAQEVHAEIRNQVALLDASIAARVRILYGGSVKAQNAAEIFAMPDIDGGLIGGASLVADEFLTICRAANR
ncbi:MAG: triose-phosphate isomerase [Betaproteobacteria bacterium]|nr:triose-phosphate isomerase [Betaproteobacteria bacterium]